jgi:hypothetical protein
MDLGDISALFGFLPVENAENFRCEFSNPIDSHSDRDLGYHRLVALNLPFRVPRFPGRRGDNTSGECADVGKELRTQGFLRAVVCDKVPYQSMPGPRPESTASAAVIAWLPADEPVAEGDCGVLKDELALPRAIPFRKSPESITPFRIGVVNLIACSEEGGLYVNAPRSVRLVNVEFPSHLRVQRFKRNVLGHVGTVKPVHLDLVAFCVLRTTRFGILRQTWRFRDQEEHHRDEAFAKCNHGHQPCQERDSSATFPERSRDTWRSIATRVSGLAVRYLSNVVTSHWMDLTGSITTASTSEGTPLIRSAEPT